MFLISCLIDLTAAGLMIALLVQLKRRLKNKEPEIMYFRYLPISVIAMAVADSFMAAVLIYTEGLTAGGIHERFLAEKGYTLLAMLISIADVYLTTVFLAFWIYYLCWHLFHDGGYIKRKFWFGATPLTVSGIVMIVCIVLIVLTDKIAWLYETAYCVFIATRVFYFGVTLWMLHEYVKQNGRPRFFNVRAFFLPVFIGWLFQGFSGLNLRAIGSAVGVILLYVSSEARQHYVDEETGTFNLKYVDYLKDLIAKGQFDPCSALIFEPESGTDVIRFSEALRHSITDRCEPIRCAENRFVVLTGAKVSGPLEMVLDDVRDATGVEGRHVMIGTNENAKEFMERVL